MSNDWVERILDEKKTPHWAEGNAKDCKHNPEDYLGSFLVWRVNRTKGVDEQQWYDVYLTKHNQVCIRNGDEHGDYAGSFATSLLDMVHVIEYKQALKYLLERDYPYGGKQETLEVTETTGAAEPVKLLPFTKDEAIAYLRRRGAKQCVCDFHGGHDEGGVEALTIFFDDDDRPAEELEEPAYNYNYLTNHYAFICEDEEDQLAALLCEVVDRRYGSFAGEYYVDGTVTLDADAGTLVLDGSEEIPQSESIYEEL